MNKLKNLRLSNQLRVRRWHSSTRYIWNQAYLAPYEAIWWVMLRYDKAWEALAGK